MQAAALEPSLHARLAALGLRSPATRQIGTIEAYAFRVLQPNDPDAWRKWAAAQLGEMKVEQALRSLETYVALGGDSAAADPEVADVMRSLREMVSGKLAQQSSRE